MYTWVFWGERGGGRAKDNNCCLSRPNGLIFENLRIIKPLKRFNDFVITKYHGVITSNDHVFTSKNGLINSQ